MSPKHFLLFILVVFILSATSQTRIEGLVHGADGMPQPYTNVLLLNAANSGFVKGELAGIDSHFSFADVRSGDY